jgi:hypothetical protein
MIEIRKIRALGRISLLVVARRQPENAAFSSEPCRGGHFFSIPSEKTLCEAELKSCIFTPKKYSAHSGIPSIRDLRNSSSEKSRFILQVEFFVKVEFYRNSTFLTFWGPRLYVEFHKNSRFEFFFGILGSPAWPLVGASSRATARRKSNTGYIFWDFALRVLSRSR